MTQRFHTGWPAVLACFWVAVFAWSLGFYGQSVFLAELQRLHGWSASLVSSATTGYYLVGAVFLAIVPGIVAQFGPRRTVFGGMALLAGGAIAMPRLTSPFQLYAADLVMAAGWAGTSGTAITAILAPWFGRRRGLAISLALNGASAAGFTFVPLLVLLDARLGFAAGVQSVVALLLLLVAPFAAILLRPPAEVWLAGERASGPSCPSQDDQSDPRLAPRHQRAALGTPRFWSIAVPFALGLTAQVGFLTHQVSFLLPQLGRDGTSVAVGLTTVAAMAGRLVLGGIADRVDPRVATAAGFGLQAAASLAMAISPYAAVLYVGCIVFGLSVGNAITLPALVVLREFAEVSFGLVIGLVTAVAQFIYAFGPLLLGVIHDGTASYRVPLLVCAALELAAATLALGGRAGPDRSKASGVTFTDRQAVH